MQKKSNAIVLLSGGIDSFACAHFMLANGYSVSGLFVEYGQSALAHERRASRSATRSLRIKLKTVQLDTGTKHGIGEVLGRNALFAMIALQVLKRPGQIVMGLHAGTPYYDCSSAFVKRIDAIVQEYTDGTAKFFAPFLSWEKSQIIEYCRAKGLDLRKTYSCERGTIPTCGKCASCLDREANDVR